MLFELQSKRHNGRDRKYRRDYLNKFYLRQQKTSTKQHMSFDYLSLITDHEQNSLAKYHIGFRRVIEKSLAPMKSLPIHLQLYQYNSGDVSSRQAPGFVNLAYNTRILSVQATDQLIHYL